MSLVNLSDSQLLSKISRRPMMECRDLLKEHGSLHALLKETSMIDAAIELATRYYYEALQRGDSLDSPALSRKFLKLNLDHYPHEVFAVIFMDNRNRVIAFEKLFYGTINGASVYPREVVRRALEHNAGAVVFAHNHPSGVAEPSHADEQITKRLKDALALVDIRVLDHFVIGDEIVSLAERGLL